ncbi:MAG: glutamate-1-semialdehyde 2,1-aminomutase [Planctomycetota bacterium]
MASSNQQLFDRARRVIPGGVNSPVRAFGPVGGTPPFVVSGAGCRIRDADGREYIDYVGSWGPHILGHAAPEILTALSQALPRGTSFGAPTEAEIELAELVCDLVPSAEMVRLVSSGTEATMTAVRLARGITGRDTIIKFEGCYHGHADPFLVAAGSGAATHGHPSSPGVPEGVAQLTRIAPFNDLAAVRAHFDEIGDRVAAIIVEPVAGNMGFVAPTPGFLAGLREIATRHGALLIFDEVMTGFRVHPYSAQGAFGIAADLTTLGKVIGGGLPVGAVAGPKKYMEQLSPSGKIYQAGTLSGNPLSVAAGIAMLRTLRARREEIYPALAARTRQLTEGWSEVLTKRGIPHAIDHMGSMFGLFFVDGPVRNFTEAKRADLERFRRFFHGMLAAGVYLAPSQFEAGFVSFAHDQDAIAQSIEALRSLEW